MKPTCIRIATLALLALSASPLAAAEYLALRFAPAEQPAVYLKFYKTTLRVAGSAAALESAPGLDPLPEATEAYPPDPREGGRTINYGYAKVPLPTKIAGFGELSISPRLIRHLPSGASHGEKQQTLAIIVPVTFATQDAKGITWSYIASQGLGSGEISTDAKSPAIVEVLPPRDLKLTLQAKPDEKTKKIGLGVQLMRGQLAMQTAMKGNAPAAVHLTVSDSTGALVQSEDGDLEKFGFT